MAPLLFLFLMQAFHEALHKEYQRKGRIMPYVLIPESSTGQLINIKNPEKTRGEKCEIGNTLFVDDGAFIFDSREEVKEFLPLIKTTFAKFGLLMHVGLMNGEGILLPSKTEIMFFPAQPSKLKMSEFTPEPIYFGERNQFHAHYTAEFKYLGSRLIPTLSDERDIELRIQQAMTQTHLLDNFWRSSTDVRIKRTLFLAIPVNTALYGCEYWAMNDKLRKMLAVFYHKCIRRVLDINMYQVEKNHIKNEHLRNKLCVSDINDIVTYRQSKFIGRLAQMQQERLPRRMIGSWLPFPRKKGGQVTTIARTFIHTLQEVLGEEKCSKHGQLNEWMHITGEKTNWEKKRKNFLHSKKSLCSHYGTGSLGNPAIFEWLCQ